MKEASACVTVERKGNKNPGKYIFDNPESVSITNNYLKIHLDNETHSYNMDIVEGFSIE